MVVAAIFAALGAIAAARWRDRLGLETVPSSLAVALILFSTPVLFAVERANYDLLIIPCVVGAAILMQRKAENADAVAARFFSRRHMGKALSGPVCWWRCWALRRWHLLAWLIAWCALIGLSDLPELRRFLQNNDIHLNTAYALSRAFPEIQRGITAVAIWVFALEWDAVRANSGLLAAALVILPLLSWVAWSVVRTPPP